MLFCIEMYLDMDKEGAFKLTSLLEIILKFPT